MVCHLSHRARRMPAPHRAPATSRMPAPRMPASAPRALSARSNAQRLRPEFSLESSAMRHERSFVLCIDKILIAQLRRHGCSRTFVEYTSDSSKNTPKLSRNTHERCHNNTQNKPMDPHQCPAQKHSPSCDSWPHILADNILRIHMDLQQGGRIVSAALHGPPERPDNIAQPTTNATPPHLCARAARRAPMRRSCRTQHTHTMPRIIQPSQPPQSAQNSDATAHHRTVGRTRTSTPIALRDLALYSIVQYKM